MPRFFAACLTLTPLFHPKETAPVATNPEYIDWLTTPITKPVPEPPQRIDEAKPVVDHKPTLLKYSQQVEALKRLARHNASVVFADIDRAYWQGRYEAFREVRDLLESAVAIDEAPPIRRQVSRTKYD